MRLWILCLTLCAAGCGEEETCAEPVQAWQDRDGDRHGGGEPLEVCFLDASLATQGGDCDDADPLTYPNGSEYCDGRDNDCDDVVDEYLEAQEYWPDADADLFGETGGASTHACSAPIGFVDNDLDCDDSRSDVRPNAAEVCDTADNDCDGTVDEGLLLTWALDNDGDGFGDSSATVEACSAPTTSHVADNTDCNDNEATIHPGATAEWCDGVDTNCDGQQDDFLIPGDYDSLAQAAAFAPDGSALCLGTGSWPSVTFNKTVYIHGAGPGLTVLTPQGPGNRGLVLAESGRVSGISTSGTVELFRRGVIENVEIRDGWCSSDCRVWLRAYGQDGEITVRDVEISDNQSSCGGTSSCDPSSVTLFGETRVERLGIRRNRYVAGASAVTSHVGISATVGVHHLEDIDIVDNVCTGQYCRLLYLTGAEHTVDRLLASGNWLSSPDSGVFLTLAVGSTIRNAEVTHNDVSAGLASRGALLHATGVGAGTVTIENATISHNSLDYPGPGAIEATSDLVLVNTSFDTNVLSAGLPYLWSDSSATITTSYSNFWSNGDDLVSDTPDPSTSTGSMGVDPQYADPGAGDFTLLSSSPLRDAGDPGVLDADGSRSDIGVWGGPGAAP